MKRITEKIWQKVDFSVENIIADEVIDARKINVQVDTVEVKGKNY